MYFRLDTDIDNIPNISLEDPIFEFNKQIIDATKDLCIYTNQICFLQYGKMDESLNKTLEYIPLIFYNCRCKEVI